MKGKEIKDVPLLPVCKLLLEVPTLAQELSTGGYDPKQNRKYLSPSATGHASAYRTNSLIHKISSYLLLLMTLSFQKSVNPSLPP